MGSRHKALSAAIMANVLEWYDVGLYGYSAPIIGPLFFPAKDTIPSLISTFVVFAIGFLVRPLGPWSLGDQGTRSAGTRPWATPLY